MSKPLIVSAANDEYLDLLDGMIASIGGKLADFDLGIIDLGLSDAAKDRIKARKADARLARAEWRRTIPGEAPEYKKVFTSKPFIPETFPRYDDYVWVDADVWFQDAGALDDYIKAGNARGGAAFSFESHPSYRSTQKIRRLEVFGKTVGIKGIKDYFLNRRREMFGSRVAAEIGMHPTLNSGLFHMAAGSPVWRAWQETLLAANLRRQRRRTQICDQTCLQVALIRRELPYAVMPATHNWPPILSEPLIDTETFALLDPAWPHPPIKAVHLVGIKDSVFDLPTTDDRRIRTGLTWADFQQLWVDNAHAGR